MKKLNCIVKILKNIKGDVVWMGLYLNGKKIIDKDVLDIEFIMNTFNPNGSYKEVEVVEEYIPDNFKFLYFPEEEDFSYLMDKDLVEEGEAIYMLDGIHMVSEVWDSRREDGIYPIDHWEEIDGRLYRSKYNLKYESHDILKFKVENDDTEYVWEDFNYQQSYLNEYLKQYNLL